MGLCPSVAGERPSGTGGYGRQETAGSSWWCPLATLPHVRFQRGQVASPTWHSMCNRGVKAWGRTITVTPRRTSGWAASAPEPSPSPAATSAALPANRTGDGSGTGIPSSSVPHSEVCSDGISHPSRASRCPRPSSPRTGRGFHNAPRKQPRPSVFTTVPGRRFCLAHHLH